METDKEKTGKNACATGAPALRASEWFLIGYFIYVAAICPAHGPALIIALLVAVLALVMAYGEARVNAEVFGVARDWIPLGLTLLAYREMDWFSGLAKDHHLELRWVEWDRWLLYQGHGQRAIEALGSVIPNYLELCYLLVYAVGPFAVAAVYALERRERAKGVVFLYLLGTLGAYALFPYFLSDPPRTLFGDTDLPNILTALRRFNLSIVGGYGIHSSVFPSAHVSSAFSAAWAFFLFVPEKKRWGWGMLIYAVSVAIATVYGRYHYAVDALAGLGVSVVAATILFALRRPLRLLRGPA